MSRIPLDTSSGKGSRGRPLHVDTSTLIARARHFEGNLIRTWNTLGRLLADARSVDEVARAFEEGANPYIGPIVWPALYPVVFSVIRERTYPKRSHQSQARFLAESLAGWGEITPRTARDICGRARKKQKVSHRILRYEFHIECSCGYIGVSRDHACPTCKARIPFNSDEDF